MSDGICDNNNDKTNLKGDNSSYSSGGRAKPDEGISRKRKGRITVVNSKGQTPKTVFIEEGATTYHNMEVVDDDGTVSNRPASFSWSSEDMDTFANKLNLNLSQSVFQQFNNTLKDIRSCIDKTNDRLERLELLLLEEDSGDEGND